IFWLQGRNDKNWAKKRCKTVAASDWNGRRFGRYGSRGFQEKQRFWLLAERNSKDWVVDDENCLRCRSGDVG
ncbi:MAG: hypothetical protein SOV75_06520, partial [Candidatus Limiplasma sp.]|nr:hypothetical protein [Candidatus Limiplasma sp.]